MTLSTDDEIEALRAQLSQVNDPVNPPVSEARSAQAQYGNAKPAGIYALSAWADLTQTNASYDARGPYDPMLSRASLQDRARMYLNGADPRSPLASPVFGDFSEFPPLLVHVGADEVLLGDAVALAREASLAGTDVTLRVWARMIHIFPWFRRHATAVAQPIATTGLTRLIGCCTVAADSAEGTSRANHRRNRKRI
jgi:acetyl esterase/lipase